MADPRTRQVFVVTLDGEKGDDLIAVDACTVYVVDGDLLFVDENNECIDMIASGYWKRCKVSRLEE